MAVLSILETWLTVIGLVATSIGAFLVGWNDIMSKQKALEIGLPRWAGSTDEENLQMPFVKELLRRNKNSRRGLSFVLLGTTFLVLAVLV